MMNLNNKGFSLVELLAVLVILSTILIIAIPSISSSLNKSEKQNLEKRKQLVLSEVELKIDNIKTCLGTNFNTIMTGSGIKFSKLDNDASGDCNIVSTEDIKDIENCTIKYVDNELVLGSCT